MVYAPLGRGLLAGKYSLEHRFDPVDDRYDHEETVPLKRRQAAAIVEALQGWAADRGRTLAQLAIAWVLANPAVTSAIVGAKNPEQARSNAAAGDRRLSSADMAEIETLTAAALTNA
jgi:aryl-alcohol dehydrogenase-like predicted oxidoreductase